MSACHIVNDYSVNKQGSTAADTETQTSVVKNNIQCMGILVKKSLHD